MLKLCERGAEEVFLKFLASVPTGAEVYWITYTLRPTSKVLTALAGLLARGCIVRFVCKHPSAQDDEPLRRKHYDQIASKLAPYKGFGLRGLRADSRLADGESGDDRFGPLHAKMIAFEHRKSSATSAIIGSANCSELSLQHFTEILLHLRDCEQSRSAVHHARQLWEASHDIDPEDCQHAAGLVPKPSGDAEPPGTIVGAPRKTGSDRNWQHEIELDDDPARYRPYQLSALARKCERLMKNWPQGGGDYQFRIFRNIARAGKTRDLLYLPVGVGKTFIAYRWLLWRIAVARRQGQAKAYGIYVCPNEWVEQSVRRDLEARGLLAEELVRVWRVGSAMGSPDDCRRAAAIVLDECHNWKPGSRPTESGYAFMHHTAVKNGIPLLGLSATPCRIDHGRFNIPAFAAEFIGEQLSSFKPRMLLKEAIAQGLLVAPKFIPFEWRRGQNKEIAELLSEGNLEWGDYSSTVLRSVWSVLNESPSRLARAVAEKIRETRVHRVLIFLPPVGNDSDRFVSELQAEIGSGNLFNFLSRDGSQNDARRIFEQFRDAPTRPKPVVLLTVDRFAEGISVPDIDMIIMLRATLSPRVFIQALGRGLRISPGKKHCIVLDPVGLAQRFERFEDSLDGRSFDEVSVQDDEEGRRTRRSTTPKEFNGWAFRRLFSRLSASKLSRILKHFGYRKGGSQRQVYERLLNEWDRSEKQAAEFLGVLRLEELKQLAESLGMDPPRSKRSVIKHLIETR